MTEATLTVPDISCAHCKATIEDAVAALDGVETVTVDIEPKSVQFVYDQQSVSLETIRAAIESAGYAVATGSDG